MTDTRYAYRVCQALNQGLQDISPATTRRLEAARHLALSRQKQPEMQLAAATANWSGVQPGSTPAYLKQTLAVFTLLLGMWIAFYWHSSQYITELEEVDSALLADDLPPEAFLDQEFFAWLNESSEE